MKKGLIKNAFNGDIEVYAIERDDLTLFMLTRYNEDGKLYMFIENIDINLKDYEWLLSLDTSKNEVIGYIKYIDNRNRFVRA